jgi:hypothetical protein
MRAEWFQMSSVAHAYWCENRARAAISRSIRVHPNWLAGARPEAARANCMGSACSHDSFAHPMTACSAKVFRYVDLSVGRCTTATAQGDPGQGRHGPRARHRQADRRDARRPHLGRVDAGQRVDVSDGAAHACRVPEARSRQLRGEPSCSGCSS